MMEKSQYQSKIHTELKYQVLTTQRGNDNLFEELKQKHILADKLLDKLRQEIMM